MGGTGTPWYCFGIVIFFLFASITKNLKNGSGNNYARRLKSISNAPPEGHQRNTKFQTKSFKKMAKRQ